MYGAWPLRLSLSGGGRQEAWSIQLEKFTYVGIRIKRLAKKNCSSPKYQLVHIITVRTTSWQSWFNKYPFEATLKPNASLIRWIRQSVHKMCTKRLGLELKFILTLPSPDAFGNWFGDASGWVWGFLNYSLIWLCGLVAWETMPKRREYWSNSE